MNIINEHYKDKDSLINWIINGDFGLDNFDRYGIQKFYKDTCVTTRIGRNEETFSIIILIQKDNCYSEYSSTDSDWEDVEWIPFIEGDLSNISNVITCDIFDYLFDKMEDILDDKRKR